MTDTAPYSALREWRNEMRKPLTLMILAGIAGILAIVGPFETKEVLRLVPRLVYWMVLVTACYSCGYIVALHFGPPMRSRPVWLRLLVLGVLTGLGVSLIVLAINWAALDFVPKGAQMPEFLAATMSISFIVSAMADIVSRQLESKHAAEEPLSVPILDRLPLEKRAELVALSVEDHYVRVHTLKGEELILHRLSDAIKEVGPTIGAQVHRSHWAAFDQVRSVRREGERAILEMSTDIEIPVSRANVEKIRSAGLLPKTR